MTKASELEKRVCGCNQDPCIHTVAPELFEKRGSREFWIQDTGDGNLCAFTSKRKCFQAMPEQECTVIRVIDYAAYEKLLARIKELEGK